MKNFTRYKFLLFLPVFVAFLAFGVQAQCPTIPNATFSSTDVTCFGANDGTVTVELGDGTGPFNYFLFDLNQGQFLLTATRTIGPANKVVFSDLPASDYIVQVRKTGCANINIGGLGITVTEPAELVLDVTSQTNITGCFGDATGGFQVAASGGNGGYTYSFNGGAFGTTTSFTNLAAGTYTVEVKDSKNCVESVSVSITEPAQLAISLTSQSDPDCNGNTTGNIVVAATGGTPAYEFSINGGAFNPGSGTFSNLAPGSYSIQVRDSKGCTVSLPTVTLTNPPVLAISLTAKTDITTCFGDAAGEIVVAASGGTPAYEFSINGGAFASASSFTNLAAGSYSVQVRDSKGCTTTLPAVSISQPTALAISLTSKTDIIGCFGDTTGEIVVAASGGTPAYEFSINGGTFASASSFTNLIAGSYSIQVRDSKGCITTLPAVTISQPTALQASVSNQSNPSCFAATDGGIALSVSGGTSPYAYSVNGGAFATGSGTFSNLIAGNYNIQVRDANGCTTILPAITLTQPDVLTVSLTSKTDVTTCFGDASGEIVINVSGGTSPYAYSVNGGAFATGTGTFSNLIAGNYNIQVRDANGCTTILPAVSLSQPTALAISLTSKTDIIGCFGDTTGEIVVAASGGTPAYEFSINGGAFASASSFTNLTAGSYSIQVRDSKGCITTLPAVTISQPILVSISLTAKQDVTCNGGATGSISVSATGGTPAYEFAINGGTFTSANVFNNLTAGTYIIQVKDSKGCVATLPATTISEPAILTASLVSKTDITGCFGDATGEIVVAASGGTPAYEFSINGGVFASGTGTFSNLIAGNYNIQVRDASGCITSLPAVTISQPVVLALSLTSKTDITGCFGDATGEIITSVSGGTSPYTYSVNGGAFASGTGTFSNLISGSYNIQIRDASGCTTALPAVSISQPTALAISLTSKTDIIGCFGDTSGEIVVAASGGTSPYTYSINGGAFTSANVFNNLSADTYTIQVKDANNCMVSLAPVTITQPVSVTASLVSKTDVSCNSGNDGSINISVSGGTSPYAYSVNGGAFATGSGTFSNLIAGNYNIQVRDANGCTTILPAITLTQPDVLTVSLTSKTDVTTCFGDASGEIVINVSGGTSPYAYSVNGGAFASGTGTFSNLAAGSYNIQVRDANGCTTTLPAVTISQPTALAVSLTSKTDITGCFGDTTGEIVVAASGGTSPYTYSINSGSFTSGTGTFTNLTAGSYSVQVKDASGCTVSLPAVTISQPAVVSISLTSKTDPACEGNTSGTINVSAAGGISPYTYAMNGGVFTSSSAFTNLAAGSYTIQVKDANGCIASLPVVTLTAPTALALSIASQNNPACNSDNNGNISVTATGGTPTYQYSINGGSFVTGNNFTNLSAGTYTITVKDANNCTTTLSNITLTAPASLTTSITSKTDLTCNGANNGSIVTSVNGGTSPYTYSINGGAFASGTGTFNNLSAGTYTITIKDVNGCTTILPATIVAEPAVLNLSITSQTDIDACSGINSGIITVAATGGTSSYTYSIDGTTFAAANTFTNLSAGSYTITVKDANNCTEQLTATITSTSGILTASEIHTEPTCNGATDGSITVNNVSGGSGSYEYSIDGTTFQNGNIFSGLSAGNYTVIVKDKNAACSATLSVTLSNPVAVNATVATANPNACTSANGSITVTASGGTSPYTYAINGGAFVSGNAFTNLAAGIYTIVVKDANGCTFTAPTATLTAPSSVAISLVSKTDILCAGSATGNITVSATGGTAPYQYSIDGTTFSSTATFNNLAAGTYSNITVKDASGCTAVLPSVTITEPTVLAINLSTSTNPSCGNVNGGTIIVAVSGGVSPYTYSINGGAFTAGSGTFNNLTAGSYTISTRDANGCTVNLTPVTLNSSSSITAAVSKTEPSACTATDGSITISGVSGGITPYTYSIDGTNFVASSSFTGLAAGSYTITVKDASGCVFTSSQTLTAPSGLTANFLPIGESGCKVNDGLIIVSGVSGAAGPYKYYINNVANPSGINNNVFISLAGGNYLLTVEAANGCSFSQTVTISSPCPPPACTITASIATTDIDCNGVNNGNLTVTASGGSGSLEYSLDGTTFQDSNTFGNLSAGAYTATIRDKNDITCTTTATANITQPTIIAATVNGTNPTGCNTTDGSITVSGVSGGTAPYTYSINGTTFQAGTSFNGLGSGSYTITIKDNKGCIITQSQNITSPGGITASISLQQNVSCQAGSDGSVSLTVSGDSGNYEYRLNSGAFQNGNSFTGLSAGNYTITVRDNSTNCTTSVLATITEPAVLAANLATKTDVTSCFGEATGSITVSATGGTAPYQYSIDGTTFSSTATFNNLAAGTYSNITVKDAKGCTAVLPVVTISQPVALAVALTSSANLTCNGAIDGQIIVSATGGTAPYSYSINGSAFASGTGTFNTLSAGTYSLQVKDANNCIASLATITLVEPSAVSATISATTQPTCNGSDGGFTVSASGGNASYTYAINGGTFGNSNVFSGLSAGSYSVQVKDATGCITTQTVTLTAVGGISALTISASAETTCGANDGTIAISVQGGTAPYAYYLNGAVNPAGSANNTFNNLAPATYSIMVEDANGCTFTQTTTIDDNCTMPVCTLAATFVKQGITCFGDNNGEITVNTNGGSSNFEYSINGSAFQNAATFSGLAAGTYTIIIRDKADNTCTITISNITIDEPTLALSANANSTNITCNSSSDGTISIVSVAGGTAPYSYSIDGGNTFFTTGSFSNLAPGTYNPVVQDANGCTVTLSAITLAESAAILATVDAVNPTACTSTDGGLSISAVSGGTAPYSYSLDGVNYQAGNIFTGLGDGTYNVFIKDANGCVIFQTKTLTSPSGITASAVVTPVTCNAGTDGTITVNVIGGSGNYEYSQDGTSYQTTNIFASLGAGNYTITARDITTTCTATVNAVITAPAVLAISLTDQTGPDCNGGNNGSITVAATGGTAPYTYSINGGAFGAGNSFANLVAGTYTIQVKDANGCMATLPVVTLTEPSSLNAAIASQSDIACNGATDGNFVITVSGGTAPYSYSMNGSAFASGTGTFNTLSAGTYSLQVKDSKGCITTVPDVTITEPALVAISLFSKTDITTCFGEATGSITVSATGGTAPYQYSIDGMTFISNTTFNNLAAGIYNNITVKDAKGCTAVLPAVSISQPTALQASISGTDPTGCTATDGSISVSGVTGGSGDYEFSINGTTFQANATFNTLPNGAYTIIIRDKNNTACTITRSATLNGGTGLTATATATNETACSANDGSFTVNVTGGTSPYQYFLGNSTTAHANGNVFSSLAPGTYSVKIVSSDNCQFTVNNIQINAANCTPACNLTARLISTNVLCNGQSNGAVELIQVTGGSGSYEFSIDNGTIYQDSPVFGNLTPGNYTITVRDKNNLTCTTTFAAPRVGTDFFVSGVIVVNQPPACSNLGGIEFNNVAGGTAPYVYSVDGVNFQSGSVFTNLISGTYQATIKDANNCQYSATVTINGASPVTATALQTAQITCNDASDAAITVTASGGTAPYQYAINSGAFASGSGVFSNLAAGTYTISVKDVNNCIFTLPAVTVSEPTAITASISAQTNPSCSTNDGSITITASGGTGTLMYSKDNGASFVNGNIFTGLAAGSYTMVVKDASGCTITLPAVTLSLPAITATVTSVDPNSCTASNGSLTVNNPAGGTAPYVYSLNGGAYQNSATFSGLASGSYSVAVRDAAGCEVVLTQSLTAAGGITAVTITPAAETSCGANNGTITVSNITGATGPFEYYIDGVANPAGINANVFTGLAPKTYTIRVLSANGCIYTSTSTVDANCTPSCNLVARLISTPVLCNGATDGTTEVIQVSGGSGSYEYSIDNGLTYQDSPVFGNLGSGVYTILVRDKNNKSCTASFVTPAVTNRFLVSGVIVVNQPKSCAEKGSIEFTNVGGGVAAYSFSIDGTTFLSNTLYPGLDEGTYQATIKDANNCTFTVPVVIVNVPPIVATATMVAPVSCNGAGDGKIKVENISGGTGTYVYSIDGTTFSGSPEFSNRQAGIHTIYVKDQNGSCVNSFQVTVTEPAKLVADLTTVQPGNCSAQDGELKLVVTTGGTAPFEYKLNNGSFQNSNTFSGLGGGSYTVTLRDAKGCTSTFTATLAVSNPISAQAIQVSPTSCSGVADGIAQINVTVGSGVYEFSKDGITYQASNTFTGLEAGNYILYVKDKTTACIASSPVTISGAVQITASIPSPVNPSTCVATDGKIQINSVNGGVGPYQFSLDSLNNFQSGSFPFEFPGLANGAYKVYIKDSKGCYGIYAFNLSSPNAVTVGNNVSITPATCKGSNNGKLDINPTGTNISGGQTPYEYSIDGTTYQTASLFTSLLAGTYVVSVKDASGCVYSYQYEITEPVGLAFDVQEISGAGCGETSGSVKVRNIQGGIAPYSFSLNNVDYQSDSLFIGLTAGAYKMYVKDASGQNVCENVIPFNVSGATPITFNVATENIGCEGGNKGKIIISNITGGLSAENTIRRFSINGGTTFRDATGSEVIFDNLAPGIYNLVINYGNNFSCTTTLREVRIISSGIPFTIDTVAATCGSPNGSATAVIPGGGNYFYSIDSLNYFQTPKFENLKPGLYKMYVKESANDKCLNIMPFIIPGPDSLKYDLIKENCFDIRLTNIRGGVAPYKVSLDGGNTFVSGNLFSNSYTAASLLTGEYTVVIVDSKGCATIPAKVKIDNRIVAKVKATLSMPDEPTGEIRIIDIRGGNAPYEVSLDGFTWGLVQDKSIPIDTVITTLPIGKYTVYVRDASGCVKEYETEIKESKFMIPNVFTPNADGVNDTFFIRNLPAGTFVTISNRWGKVVYTSNNYQNDWDGGNYPDGVYYYSVNIAGSGQFTGWVQIWR